MIMKWLNFKSTLYTVLALFLFCPEDALTKVMKKKPKILFWSPNRSPANMINASTVSGKDGTL